MVATSDSPNPPKLLEQVVARLRVKHYSRRTEEVYVDWIKRFVWFHGKRHPKDMEAADVEAFLTHLAVAGKVSASTQNQAKSALLFLYREVLTVPLVAVTLIVPPAAVGSVRSSGTPPGTLVQKKPASSV